MNDPEPSPAERLDRFRNYLHLLARLQMGFRTQGGADASDLVQQTLVQALRNLSKFRGSSEAEMAAWLRQIMARQLANFVRDQHRQKRDCGRQLSLEGALAQSASRLEVFLAGGESSPSTKAIRNEEGVRLADALAALPDAQREAIVLHHLQHFPLETVGRHLERSPAAAAGLIKRGLRELRMRLQASS
jgi:RNA polymerase sigma-70 factor (ECF subfamily)